MQTSKPEGLSADVDLQPDTVIRTDAFMQTHDAESLGQFEQGTYLWLLLANLLHFRVKSHIKSCLSYKYTSIHLSLK